MPANDGYILYKESINVLSAINARKGKYVVLKGAFSEMGIGAFLKELSTGRLTTPLVPISGVADGKLPIIDDSEPWDGKDGKLDIIDDIDLSDVNLDNDGVS